MIIAAYAGTGKSYAAQKLNGILDMAIVPYKYQFPEDYDSKEYTESDKDDIDFPLDWDYPEKYVRDLFQNAKVYDHVFIPTDNRVLDILDREGAAYLLCYPTFEAKEEYRQRYIARGNTDSFFEIFIGRWEKWMDSFGKRSCRKYVMRQGEFLVDVILQQP